MTQAVQLEIPLNRVEGDLTIRTDIDSGVVRDAWSSGTLYRGFEKLLEGRGILDGLVITPRVCGICSTAHLMAACLALEDMNGALVPDNAIRIRNLALMVENVQSDLRHGILTFFADFTNPIYAGFPLYQEALTRFTPLKGRSVMETVRQTRNLLQIVAILGGQWPHSSFMVPGGIASAPSVPDLLQCRILLAGFRKFYETEFLGCSLQRWQEIRDSQDLDRWLDESDTHRNSDLGIYIRFARDAKLDLIGKGCGNFLSYGACPLPRDTSVRSGDAAHLIPSGFLRLGDQSLEFDQQLIGEDTSHAWYADQRSGLVHPMDSDTVPYATGREGQKYTWIKAPRYDGAPAETGPLAEMLMKGHPLITNLVQKSGPNVFVRQLARLIRPAELLIPMDEWLKEAVESGGSFYEAPEPIVEGAGAGLIEATRGALGHWVKAENGRITSYQMIPPTSWNGSPRDGEGVRGPWEEALVGTEVSDPENPVQIGHVIRSFDACLVCSVHVLPVRGKGRWARI